VTRTSALIVAAAVVVGFALAGGFVLIGADDDGQQPPQATHPPTSERAPEAESSDVGELPAVEAAARRFLSGYLRVTYGKPGATIDDIDAAAPRLLKSLKNSAARVTPAQSQRTPRVQRVAVVADGTITALATAQIKDSPSPAYPLSFHLQKTAQGWVVTRIGGP
jgi:hypothetical protein